MKRIVPLSLSISLILFTASSFINLPGSLRGRWEKKLNKDLLLRVVFRSDSSYESFANGKSFLSGKYYVRQDTIRIRDVACGGNYNGTYKLTFVTSDSIRFTAIQDSCTNRLRTCDGLTMGRIKSTSSN